jgi:hypothetical protein
LSRADFRQDRFWGEAEEGLGSVKQGDDDLDEGEVDDDNNDVDDEDEINDCESNKETALAVTHHSLASSICAPIDHLIKLIKDYKHIAGTAHQCSNCNSVWTTEE